MGPPAESRKSPDGTADDERYTIVPSASGGWGLVSAALARKLRSLDGAGGWYVIVEAADPKRNFFAQAHVCSGGELVAEVVSDRFRTALGGPLSAGQLKELASAGWRAPTDDDRPNWRQRFGGPSRHGDAAFAMIYALAAILGVSETEDVHVTTRRDGWLPTERTTGSG